jgi:hypothetical protein
MSRKISQPSDRIETSTVQTIKDKKTLVSLARSQIRKARYEQLKAIITGNLSPASLKRLEAANALKEAGEVSKANVQYQIADKLASEMESKTPEEKKRIAVKSFIWKSRGEEAKGEFELASKSQEAAADLLRDLDELKKAKKHYQLAFTYLLRDTVQTLDDANRMMKRGLTINHDWEINHSYAHDYCDDALLPFRSGTAHSLLSKIEETSDEISFKRGNWANKFHGMYLNVRYYRDFASLLPVKVATSTAIGVASGLGISYGVALNTQSNISPEVLLPASLMATAFVYWAQSRKNP